MIFCIAIFVGGYLTNDTNVTQEELAILSFLARENLLLQKLINFQNLSLFKLSNKDNEMLFAQFCSFVFNASFDTKHIQVLVNKGFPNFCSKDVRTVSLAVSLYMLLLWAGYCLPSYIDFFV